jgi:hypothetical protein
MARGYLIGEGYRDRIDRTITRVDGLVDGSAATQIPTRLQEIGGSSQKTFRVCTYTGAWSIGSSKTVTFRGVTATPNTVSATNLFFPITNTATTNRDCAIAKDGTAWYLVDVKFVTATAVFVTATATHSIVTDVTLSGAINTTNCSVSIGKTLTTASRIFVTTTATATYIFLE